jgi:hypothetical protein
MNDNIEVLRNRIQVKNWVIEQHKIALQRLGDAIEVGDQEQIAHLWISVKAMAYRVEPE